MNSKDEIIEMIISLLKGCNNNGTLDTGNNKLNCKYLLGQVLRQLHTKLGHLYISKGAKDLWNKMTDKNICEFWYNKNVKIDNPNFKQKLSLYKGNSNTPTKEKLLTYNDSFKYREIFHDEHIIPIADIETELLKLSEPNYEDIQKIINKICICKMLKNEDKNIKQKYNRGLDCKSIIKEVYNSASIEIEVLK